MRIVYAGTPEFAVPALEALIGSRHTVVGVYTQPDRRAGRGRKPRPSPIKALAEQQGLAVFQPHSLKQADDQRTLAELHPDLIVVAAYGLILPQVVLDIPRLGCINLHASLLPRWRGAAPIQRAILAGDSETGVTLMQMEAGLDTGPMLRAQALPIGAQETAGELHDRLARLGAEMLLPALDDLAENRLSAQAQGEAGITYAHKLTKDEARVDWQLSAADIAARVRAYNPWPVAFSRWRDSPLRIWRAEAIASNRDGDGEPGTVLAAGPTGIEVACGSGRLRITELQRAGKKAQSAAAFLRAVDLLGETLG